MLYLSTEAFLRELNQRINAGEKFCFILGAGASIISGVSGAQIWLDEIRWNLSKEANKKEIDRRIMIKEQSENRNIKTEIC